MQIFPPLGCFLQYFPFYCCQPDFAQRKLSYVSGPIRKLQSIYKNCVRRLKSINGIPNHPFFNHFPQVTSRSSAKTWIGFAGEHDGNLFILSNENRGQLKGEITLLMGGNIVRTLRGFGSAHRSRNTNKYLFIHYSISNSWGLWGKDLSPIFCDTQGKGGVIGRRLAFTRVRK